MGGDCWQKSRTKETIVPEKDLGCRHRWTEMAENNPKHGGLFEGQIYTGYKESVHDISYLYSHKRQAS